MNQKAALPHPTLASAAAGGSPYTRRFWLVLGMLLVFSIILKLPTLSFSHDEPDERIYLTLATQLLNYGSYNLSGTQVLQELSPQIYDRPLFFHPPLFPAVLIPFVYWKVENLAIVVSWLGHLLCIVAVALIGARITLSYGFDRNPIVQWLPVIGVCLDPLLIFISRKLWIDSLLCGMCAASIAAFFCARYSRRRSLWLVAGGVLFGLAGLCKMPALILAPVVVYLIFTPESLARSKIVDFCLGCGPALLLALPWYLVFYHTFGVFIPSWIKPDEWLLEHYPFVRVSLERTPAYYLIKLATIAPVTVLCFIAYGVSRPLWTNRVSLVPPLWFLLYFAAISYVGMEETGFQMRYIAPLVPSIYLMLYTVLARFRLDREVVSVLVLLLLIYAGLNGAIYLIVQYDEIYSIFELAGWFHL
jgi:4-amino-4-deoxy-L-arabinose transferase-like glycosyltransferase